MLTRRQMRHVDPARVLATFSRHARITATHLLYTAAALRQGFATAFRDQSAAAVADAVEQVAESIKTTGPHSDAVEALRALKAEDLGSSSFVAAHA